MATHFALKPFSNGLLVILMSSEPLEFFSTNDTEPYQSLNAWRRHMAEIYYELDIKPAADGPFAGSLTKRSVDRMAITRLAADAHRVVRSKYLALGDDAEHFCLVFPLKGTFEYRQHGKENKAGAGDVYILNAQEAYEVDLPHDAELLSLALPSDLARARISGIEDLCGSSRFADPAIAPALSCLVKSLLMGASDVTSERLQDLCLDMADLLIVPDSRRERRVSYSDSIAINITAKARQFMRGALGNPHLDAAKTALACGVSVRQLQSAFQKGDTTFGAELLEQRLLKAFRLLRSTAASSRMIGTIAADCGFKSQSHFSVRFKQRFGRSPRDVR